MENEQETLLEAWRRFEGVMLRGGVPADTVSGFFIPFCAGVAWLNNHPLGFLGGRIRTEKEWSDMDLNAIDVELTQVALGMFSGAVGGTQDGTT